MSTSKNLRKRARINYNKSVDTATKKVKTETARSYKADETNRKQPIIAPNGKVFYPCQYCSKIFPHKLTSISHMNRCTQKMDETLSVLNGNKPINNNDIDIMRPYADENVNDSSNGGENKKSTESGDTICQKAAKNDVSIYDYNEDDISDDGDLKESDEETLNNRQCKHCNTLFDNPLDMLRHTRHCHNFPRTILPPNEIEKYFDYPNRKFCPICEKPIKTRNFRSVFIKHLLVHTTGLTHECKVCKKKFRRRDHMRAHEKRHIVSA